MKPVHISWEILTSLGMNIALQNTEIKPNGTVIASFSYIDEL